MTLCPTTRSRVQLKDIDLLIKPDADNARAVYAALQKFGAPMEGLEVEDFIERDKFFRMEGPPVNDCT